MDKHIYTRLYKSWNICSRVGNKMNYFRIVLAVIIFIIVDSIVLVSWHKNIDAKTTWIYGIYVIVQTILWLSVVIIFEQYWSTH